MYLPGGKKVAGEHSVRPVTQLNVSYIGKRVAEEHSGGPVLDRG